jgi:hypothetical protein
MAVLDDEALVIVPAIGERFEPIVSMAGGKLDAALSGIEGKLAQQMRDMSPRERAMMEQMMGPGFAEQIAQGVEAAQSMMTGATDATLRLPGPPPDRPVARYYLLTMMNFDLDGDTEDRRWTGQGTAQVVARLEKAATGSRGGTPQLPNPGEIQDRLGWPGTPTGGDGGGP